MRLSNYNIWLDEADTAYVYNGVSGALLKIPREEVASLRNYLNGGGPIEQCSPQLLERLALGRMLINDDTDELDLLVKRHTLARSTQSRLNLTIITSLGCNFACSYCFEDKHVSVMDETVQGAICELVKYKISSVGTLHVTWYGGEPLLGKTALLRLSEQFIEMTRNANVEYSSEIVTNGYLLNEVCCRELAEHRVSQAQVSLDGPADVHDRMRPLVSGRGSFHRILRNLRIALKYFDKIAVRMNVNSENQSRVDELLKILAGEGFAGKVAVYPGQIIAASGRTASPAKASYAACLQAPEFADVEVAFRRLGAEYGFLKPALPQPIGSYCTVVCANDVVIGSEGELYKCLKSVGSPSEIVGYVIDWQNPNTRLGKWLKYDPFSDMECRKCIALPVCMGGCVHNAIDPLQYGNRCNSFRFNHAERVFHFVKATNTGMG